MQISTCWSWWKPSQCGGILGWIYYRAGPRTWTLFGFQYDGVAGFWKAHPELTREIDSATTHENEVKE